MTGNERKWTETRKRTYKLYNCETQQSHTELLWRAKRYGITNAQNNRFLLDSKKNTRIRDLMEALEVNQLEKWKLFNPFLKLEGKFFQPYWKIGRIKISIQKNFDSLIICFPNHWTLFFDFSGFDGVKDTPVEILHVVLLGFVKYLARDLHENLTESQKEEAAGRLNSFNTEHLNTPPINAKALLTHIKSLVGKEFKILIQAAPFVFFKFLSAERKALWTPISPLYLYYKNKQNG